MTKFGLIRLDSGDLTVGSSLSVKHVFNCSRNFHLKGFLQKGIVNFMKTWKPCKKSVL
jgi:hypothetical protein